jgi:hypothetical protein
LKFSLTHFIVNDPEGVSVEVAEKLSGNDVGVSPHYLQVAAVEAVLERAVHCCGGRQALICTWRRVPDDVHLRRGIKIENS